jgi:chromosome segregation ATPase
MVSFEIFLIIFGAVLVGASFFFTKKLSDKEASEVGKMSDAEIKTIIGKKIEESASLIDEKIDNKLNEAVDSLERRTDKETNDKIKEISEYSDTVLTSMNKSHDEIVFMYDMLNQKQEKITALTNTLSQMEETIRSLKEDLEKKNNIRIVEKKQNEEELQSLREEFIKKYDEEKASKKNLKPDKKAALEKNDVRTEIVALSKQGYKEVDIAKKLGLGIGEVKLVLGLFKR